MVSPDDIASLKVAVQKLAVALEGFSLKLAAQGLVNYSNATLDAQQVFDKLSEPILSPNLDQVAVTGDDHSVLNDIDEHQPGVNGVREPKNDDIVPDYVRADHNQFRRTPIPEFILQMAKAAETTHGENEEMVVSHQLFDTMPEPTVEANVCASIVEVAMTSAKIVEFDAIQDDYEPASAVQNDHFTQKEYLFAKLGALEGSHLRDVVIICANRMRFSTILGSLSNGCQHSEKMSHEVEKHYDRKMNSESECPRFEVSVMSSIVSDVIPPLGLIKNVVLPLLWGDLDWFMGSSLSQVLGMEVFYTTFLEPDYHRHIHSLCFECPLLRLTLSGFHNVLYISSRHNYEAARLINEERILQLFDSKPLRSKYTTYAILNSPIKPDVDKGSTKLIISCPHRLTSALESDDLSCWDLGCNLECHVYIDTFMESHYKLFDPGIGVIKILPFHNSTLEDKCDFRGEEGTSSECTWELFNPLTSWSNYITIRIYKSIVFLTYVFDPGGLCWQYGLRDDHCYLPESHYVQKNTDGGKFKINTHCPVDSNVRVCEKTIRVLISYNLFWLQIGSYTIFNGALLLPAEDSNSEHDITRVEMVILPHASVVRAFAYKLGVDLYHQHGHLITLGNFIQKGFLLLVLTLLKQISKRSLPLINYRIFVFDPGGDTEVISYSSSIEAGPFVDGMKLFWIVGLNGVACLTHNMLSTFKHFKENLRVANKWFITVVVINILGLYLHVLIPSQTAMTKHTLEDKGDLKGRVMMHIEYESKGSFVIFLICVFSSFPI